MKFSLLILTTYIIASNHIALNCCLDIRGWNYRFESIEMVNGMYAIIGSAVNSNEEIRRFRWDIDPRMVLIAERIIDQL